jgi:hypothetical protein
MSPVNGKTVLKPTLYDLFQNMKGDVFASLNAVKLGTIQSYDSVKQTASVQVAFDRVLNSGSSVPMPKLVDVPVIFQQGGGIGMRFPVEAGDECILLFNDANIDAWFASGGNSKPMTGRQHDVSDAVAFVGPNSLANALTLALADDEGGFADATAKVAITGGKITLANVTGTLLSILQTWMTSLAALFTALGADPGLQPATQAAATAAATATTIASAALGALLY